MTGVTIYIFTGTDNIQSAVVYLWNRTEVMYLNVKGQEYKIQIF